MEYRFPEDIKYTPTHEWVKINGEFSTIGITDYAQHQLGDIVYIELPDIGIMFEKGSNAAEIESVKAVGELLMPLSGEIVELNEKLNDSPEIVNSSPYEEGWILKLKFNHPDELTDLLSAKEYKDLVQKADH